MKNFFERPKSINYEKDFFSTFNKKINIKNIDELKKKSIVELFNPQYEKEFLAFRFDILKQWMLANKEYSKEYVIALDDMIDKLCLTNELNSWEQQYIKNIQAVVFAKWRNLKQLIVDFPINKGEFVFYRYDLDEFKQINKKGLLQMFCNPEMYITTHRIIISKNIDTISIYFNEIKNYNFVGSKFSINLLNNCRCFVTSENDVAIVESLKRVLTREKITFDNDK